MTAFQGDDVKKPFASPYDLLDYVHANRNSE